MTLWNKGTPIKFHKKIDDFFGLEMIRPKNNYFIMFIRSGEELYYTIRYWKGADTPWMPAKLVTNDETRNKVFSLLSQRDKFPNSFAQVDDYTIQSYYINPEDLEEIKEIEKENPP